MRRASSLLRSMALLGMLAGQVLPAAKAHAVSEPSVLIVTIPALSAGDVRAPELSSFRMLLSRGACGWMNVRTGITPDRPGDPTASGYLTIGAGVRAVADARSAHGAPVDTASLARANRGLGYLVPLGALGSICREANLDLRVVGDTDDTASRREAALLAMDRSGRLDAARSAHIPDRWEPYGLRSDLTVFKQVLPRTLTVWVFGDIARADAYASVCTPAVAAQHRRRARARLDAFLRLRVLAQLDAPQNRNRPILVMAFSPVTSALGRPSDRLVPIVVIGPGFGPGFLASSTTRRKGLALSTDLLPTVAEFLNVKTPEGVTGRPLRTTNSGAVTLSRWLAMRRAWVATSAAQYRFGGMPNVRMTFLIILIIAMTLAARPAYQPWAAALARGTAGATLSVLVPQIYSGLAAPPTVLHSAVTLYAFALLGGSIALISHRASSPLAYVVCAAAAGAIAIDLFLGARRIPNAWLSYNVMYGTRLYGIGNEMAGALLAASVVCLGPALRRQAYALAGGAFALLTAAVFLPMAGANFGSSLALFTVAVVLGAHAVPRGRRWGFILLALLTGAAAGALVLHADSGADASHLGRAAGMGAGLGDTIIRKLALNARTIMSGPWTVTVIAGLVGIRLLYGHRSDAIPRPLVRALLAGAAALFLFNDTGVVAAGMCLSVALPALCLIYASATPKLAKPERVGHD